MHFDILSIFQFSDLKTLSFSIRGYQAKLKIVYRGALAIFGAPISRNEKEKLYFALADAFTHGKKCCVPSNTAFCFHVLGGSACGRGCRTDSDGD